MGTRKSETINWKALDNISKEPRFGRRIDPVTNTFENRLSQVRSLVTLHSRLEFQVHIKFIKDSDFGAF